MSDLIKARWRISLTANGAGYLCSMGVLFLMAVNYNSNLLFTLCFILIGVMVVCFWLCIVNIKSIKASSVSVQPVHAGQSLEFKIDVADKGLRRHVDLLLNGLPVGDVPRGLQKTEQLAWVLSDVTNKRGLHAASMSRIGSRWPLGLFKSARDFIALPRVVIYPAAADSSITRYSVEGDDAHLHNDADTLQGLKEYQPGDNARRIDWRAMARRDQLQVKLFDGGSGDASVWIDWDDTQDLPYELRISRLCRWMVDYNQQGVEFGLRLPGFSVAPANSYSHLHQCLYQLAMMPQSTSIESTSPESAI